MSRKSMCASIHIHSSRDISTIDERRLSSDESSTDFESEINLDAESMPFQIPVESVQIDAPPTPPPPPLPDAPPLAGTNEELIEWLTAHHLINGHQVCGRCGRPPVMQEYSRGGLGFIMRCTGVRCRRHYAVMRGSYFFGTRLP
eukprot:gnl/Trimastix_PCT/1887.p4 GENE.gnl/Trimastix_PCT/1887~~gnl/Trimastix_PCT/1887.p4  ORF type:complete len:144 (-),score=14.90 gnl/Trimastix_PCT/1887:580-1011(-)